MADFAISSVLTKLRSLLDHNNLQLFLSVLNLPSNIDTDLWLITNQLNTLRATLRTAEQVEVVHEVEDFLDEFSFHFSRHQDSQGLCAFLRNLNPSSIITRHQIASNINSIKSKINYLMENSTSVASSMELEEDVLPNPRQNALLEEHEILGVEVSSEILINWLVHESDTKLKVISVLGMVGLGKTTLVKKVYDDTRVKQHFQMQAWINASESMSAKQLLKEMIQQLYRQNIQEIPQGMDGMNFHTMGTKIKEFLCQNSINSSGYVLVLDGVQDTRVWDKIKRVFPRNSDGRVLITTCNGELANVSSRTFNGHIYNLGFLSKENSSLLFNRMIFQQDTCPFEFKEISELILYKCGGLPLAIVAFSNLFLTKNEPEEWEKVYKSLGEEIESNDRLEDLKKVLTLSIDYLPVYLKPCYLYLSVFPKEQPMECTRLIRLWIAEGLVQRKEGITMEDVAHGYLKELLNRSLMQVMETTSDGRIKTCRVHDLLQEIIISKCKTQNFAVIARTPDAIWHRSVRRLSIQSTLHQDEGQSKPRTLPRLRSLFMFGGAQDSSSVYKWFSGGFKMLNVLDLQATRLEIFPDQVANLCFLKYLSFRGTKLKKIPSSIKKLQNLETLDLKNACVTDLPTEILKLRRLKHLLVYRYDVKSRTKFEGNQGFKVLSKIGKLKSLQKLCFAEVDKRNKYTFIELGKLNKLVRLGITKLKKRDGEALCFAIANMKNLHALSITSVNKHEVIDLQHLNHPLATLRRLYLRGPLQDIPQWITSLNRLQRLYLKWSQLSYDPLEVLQHLGELIHLELLKAYSGVDLCFKAFGFPKLKFLSLDKFEELKTLRMEENTMPFLEKLIIQKCEHLNEVLGIEHLKSIKYLEFLDMPESLTKNMYHQNVIAHIPEVYSTCWNGEGWYVENLGNQTNHSVQLGIITRRHELRDCKK